MWIGAIDLSIIAARRDGETLPLDTIASAKVDVRPLFATAGPIFVSRAPVALGRSGKLTVGHEADVSEDG